MTDQTSYNRLTLINKGKYYLVTLPGKLGQQEADSLLGIKTAMEKRPGANLILDFSETIFLDSRSVGQLALLNQMISKNGGILSFASVPDRVLNLLSMTRITENVVIHSNLEAAAATIP